MHANAYFIASFHAIETHINLAEGKHLLYNVISYKSL